MKTVRRPKKATLATDIDAVEHELEETTTYCAPICCTTCFASSGCFSCLIGTAQRTVCSIILILLATVFVVGAAMAVEFLFKYNGDVDLWRSSFTQKIADVRQKRAEL